MLDGIKTSFSISDLASMSGISVHTIRIWERRYNLLEPQRTDSNIRRYSNDDLKKILNISLLLKAGHKISHIADFSEQQLLTATYSLLSKPGEHQHAINEMKMAMLNFDSRQFEDTYQHLTKKMLFTDVFKSVMIPFLEEIGSLWQTKSITVAHEHYISSLLRQKLFYQIENLPMPKQDKKEVYILFLPLSELHELGLLFLHYFLRLNGHESIYLGPNVDIPTLSAFPAFQKRIFITYLTYAPEIREVPAFIEELKNEVLSKKDRLMAVGHRMTGVKKPAGWASVSYYTNLQEILLDLPS